jgi:hypothetical protein
MALCVRTSPGKRGRARVLFNSIQDDEDGDEGLAGDRAELPERGS